MNVCRTIAAALVLAATAAAGAHANDGPDIRVEPSQPKAGSALQIEIDAVWGDACPPRFESTRIAGADIIVRAVRDPGRCSAEQTPYRISAGLGPDDQDLGILDANALLAPARDGVYRVRYEVRHGSKGDYQLHGFRLLQVGTPDDAGFVPETGFWWPELGGEFGRAGPGIGVQLEVQSGTVSLSALGYGPDGRAGWFFGVGALQGRVAHLEMSLLDGGSGPFETYEPPKSIQAVGQAELEVISPSRAVLWFVRAQPAGQEVRLEPMSIVRFSFAQEPGEALLGRWLIVAENDDATPTRRIALSRMERKSDGLALHDADGEHALVCESAAALPNSPPGLCRLESASAPELAIEFTDVGLQQMRGWSASGKRMLAFRIEP